MVLPVPAVYVKAAPTFFKATRQTTSSFSTNSGTYVDNTNLGQITSVPDDAKVLWGIHGSKSTAGTGDVRVTDGTNTFGDETGMVSGVSHYLSHVDGLDLQDSGGAATVKMQVLSSDANNMSVQASSGFILCTDGDVPNIITGAALASYKFPMKISLAKVFIYYVGIQTISTDLATIASLLSFQESSNDSAIKSAELTKTLPNEQIFNYITIELTDAVVLNQFVIWDWSGNGVSFA